jgi:hypothetical protein
MPTLFGIDALVPFSLILTAAVAYVLFKTKMGLVIRAVGNSHNSAHALGYRVIALRYLSVMFGGACAGLAGGYLSLAYTPQWIENMTAGRGWIALALVVFASWRPLRTLVGAYLFGAVSILGFVVQSMGLGIPSQFLSALPYLVTIVALVIISGNKRLTQANTPACLAQSFVPDGEATGPASGRQGQFEQVPQNELNNRETKHEEIIDDSRTGSGCAGFGGDRFLADKYKACWVYVGPVGDGGYTYSTMLAANG